MMFNSVILDDYPVLQKEIWDRQKEIVELYYDLWRDNQEKLDGLFEYFFPQGFISRDENRAKKVIHDIWDIAQSPVIRRDLKAIYCYVMYQMIDVWFDDSYIQTCKLLPDSVSEYVTEMEQREKQTDEEEHEDLTESERIRKWFTDKESCQDDLESAYDEDFMDETTAEAAAEMFLSDEGIPDALGIEIEELVDLLPNDLYERVTEKLREDKLRVYTEAKRYSDNIWPRIESFFHVLIHSDSAYRSSCQGAKDILEIFKDWVENGGGWKDIQNAGSFIREATVHRLIHLGAITYLQDQNLDMNCENNIGVGQEDIKISRGNDKTVIEVKLTSNSRCRHGFEKQLPRYAEAEHTGNMIFCLIDLGDSSVVTMIKELRETGLTEHRKVPDLIIIDAKPQKPASRE